jgi:hypothetical protein
MNRFAPLPLFPAPLVRILATPIAWGWRYTVAPQGRGKVTAYRLDHARATARRYSRKVVEIGPRAAFPRQRRRAES